MTFSAPLLWIVAPLAVAAVLYLLRPWPRLVLITGVAVALGLALAAWRLPINEVLSVGSWAVKVEPALSFFGRQLELTNLDRPLLTLIYLGAAFWFGGTFAAHAGRLAVPLGLAAVALLTAALAVEPFLYAALLINAAALVCVPILAAPGQNIPRGALRFLAFQTFGMPFILFTGHLLAGIEANPGDQTLMLRVGLLMGSGFSFLLAIFPFHSWLPMLAEEVHPYKAALVFTIFPEMVVLFGLSFLDRYAWVRSTPVVFTALLWSGVLMVVTGGVWAAFQRHLGRVMGYAVMVEIGLMLLSLAAWQINPAGLLLHFILLPPRALALGVWALALSVFRQKAPDLSFEAAAGWARQLPLAATALALACFSLAGLPLLAGFPVHLALRQLLTDPAFILRQAAGVPGTLLGQNSLLGQFPWAAWATLVGSLGLMIGGLRSLAALLGSAQDVEWRIKETPWQAALLLAGLFGLLLLGVFPQWFWPLLANLPRAFGHLAP